MMRDMLGAGDDDKVGEAVRGTAVFEPDLVVDFKPTRFAGELGAISSPP